MNETAWVNLEEDKAIRLPTPPVGWPVQWFPSGDQRQPVAARVIKVEGPGRVKLKLEVENAFHKDMAGVYHVTHRIHQKQNNQTTIRCGSWEYLPGMNIPSLHYELFDEDIKRREEGLVKAEDLAVKQAAKFQADQAKKAQEAKKRLPEILPAHA